MKDETKKVKLYTRRAIILGCVKVVLLASTTLRFYYLQAIDGIKYKRLSDKNRIRVRPIFAERGKILDRNNKVLAKNLSYFDIVANDPTIKEIELLQRLVPDYSNSANADKHRINWQQLSQVVSNKNFLQNVEIEETKVRNYPEGKIMGHVTGYISKSKNDKRHIDLAKGVAGAEHAFETKLAGVVGRREVEVNARNQFVRQINNISSVKGDDLKLSLDTRLHQMAAEALEDKQGTIVIQDIKSGEVLCLYSQPNYDPNQFIRGFSHAEWGELQNDPGRPFVNKAISGIYPPGSVFKMVSALAILQSGADPSRKLFCSGKHKIAGRNFHCWNRAGHGEVDFLTAIKKSCNVYFYKNFSENIGVDHIHKAAEDLGIIGKTGIELSSESNSFIPNKLWKQEAIKQSWLKGDTINACIGQGFVSMTPIGINALTARIATGNQVQPSILFGGSNVNFNKLRILEPYLKQIREGLYQSVNKPGGTIYFSRLKIKGFELCGKTGTAQVVSLNSKNKIDDHSVFSGFAPYHNPRYAITVLVEFGSWGSRSAAPIAKKMMRELYYLGLYA